MFTVHPFWRVMSSFMFIVIFISGWMFKKLTTPCKSSFCFKYKTYLTLTVHFIWMLMVQIVFICCTSHYIPSGSSRHISIDPSMLSYCFWTSTTISLTLHFSFPFLQSNRTICHILMYQCSLIRILLRDTSQCWRQ